MSTFLLIAKAGGSGEAAENTCEAVSRSAELRPPTGVELAIEVDLRLSNDCRFIAMHDARLERTTDGVGLVRQHRVRELCRLQAGPAGERVPALADVLEAASDRRLLLELHDDDIIAAQALCRELARFSPRRREQLWIASEHTRVINALRWLDPTLRTAATKREAWGKLLLGRIGLSRLAARGNVWIVPERHAGLQVVTPRFVHEARSVGDPVWVFVVDDADSLRRLRSWGVSGCVTTRPGRLATALAQS
ncbi:MAG TPA: glycerophosphodiester phosphodiesterase family protein [Polyangiaceae bacterium]|nr:glycerophosphodiester phosphodiesterase family protein [Polyangiaceae bacterium]